MASRANVPPFHVMDLLAASAERQRTHGDLVNLLAGQPSTGAPEPVNAEAIRLLSSGDPLGYTPAAGILELREAIAGHHRRTYGIEVSADEVVVTTGSSGGFLLAFLAAFENGDRVAIARPGYPCYRNVLAALGCEVVEIPTGPETRFQPTVEQVDQLHRTAPIRGLVVASPANPTGTMLLPDELAALATWCEQNAVQLISDEIYHGIEYAPIDGHAPLARSAWETSREAVVFASFSKYFSMTGWRIGWMLVPDRLRRAVDVLTGNFTICPPVLAQRACLQAFADATYAELDGHVRRYAENRQAAARGAAAARHHRARAGRRRVLRLRRRRAPHRRLDGLRPRPAGAHRRRRRDRHRLRHRGGPPVHPVQLRRPARGHRGGPQPAGGRAVTPDVEVAIAAAEAGAAVIRATYGGPVTRYAKSATDFATETDLEAERAIKATVREAFPDDAFLGEEGGLDGPPDATRTWLVDPLCGTLNFAATTPLVAVNVALRHGDDVVAAAVIDPFAGETYWSDGTVARLRTGCRRARAGTLGRDPPGRLDFDGNPGWAAAVAGSPGFTPRFGIRGLSTSLAATWVASGRRAAYLQHGDVRDSVHFAAPIAVCRAAGCVITGLDGGPSATARTA